MDEFLKLIGEGNPDDLARIKANLKGTVISVRTKLDNKILFMKKLSAQVLTKKLW
jgi:hypothetical protein